MTEAEEPLVGEGAEPGANMKHRVLVHGLAQHHAYHGGQIALLRRALEAAAPS